MAISLSDLPPAYQNQAARKWAAQQRAKVQASGGGADTVVEMPLAAAEPGKEPKYHNRETVVSGITFDSRKEARRYKELMVLLHAGEIRDLRLQEAYVLQQAYTQPDGTRIRAITYLADFSYWRPTSPDVAGAVHWVKTVEDVKSTATRTKAYIIKRKMMAEVHGINIKEI